MSDNLYRFSFPVPLHGHIRTFTFHVRGYRTPQRTDLLDLMKAYQADCEIKGEWLESRKCESAVYSLHNLDYEFPDLPIDGRKSCPVPCQTLLGRNIIQVSLVQEHHLSQLHMA